MTDTAALREALEAAEQATGPDRRIDCQIWAIANGKGRPLKGSGSRLYCNPSPDVAWIGYDLLNVAEKFTGSIDAVVALIEREMPEARKTLIWSQEESRGIVRFPAKGIEFLGMRDDGEAALALLAAFLRAKLAEKEQQEAAA